MKRAFLFILFTGISAAGFTQRLIYGNSVSFLNPVHDLGKLYGSGYAFKANLELRTAGPLSVSAEIGWNKWSSDQYDGVAIGDAVAIDIMGGLRLNLIGPLYTEGRAGYYFGDFDKFTLIPAAGLRLRRFDVNIGYQLLNNLHFFDTRVGIFWGRSR
jgi:hypothetical protein